MYREREGDTCIEIWSFTDFIIIAIIVRGTFNNGVFEMGDGAEGNQRPGSSYVSIVLEAPVPKRSFGDKASLYA